MKLSSSQRLVLDRVKATIKRGNVNRVNVKNGQGEVVLLLPDFWLAGKTGL